MLNSILTAVTQWLQGVPWEPYVIAAGISVVFAVSEIVSVFEFDPVRALRTGGSFLLLFLNALFVVLMLALIRKLRPSEDYFWLAVGVGFGLPTLLRTRFTLIKPLPGAAGEGVDLSLDQIYGRLQGFCKRRIDIALASQRVSLVEQAMHELDLQTLVKRLRLLLEGGLQTVTEAKRGYVDKILDQKSYDEERKLMLLAFAILNEGDYRMLQAMLKTGRGKRPLIRRRRPKPPAARPPTTPVAQP